MITAFSFSFLGIYNASAALFRSMQKTKVTMFVSSLKKESAVRILRIAIPNSLRAAAFILRIKVENGKHLK